MDLGREPQDRHQERSAVTARLPIDTAVVLAGGFGTRLAAVVSDVPKPMAPVAGRPFLEHLLLNLARQGLRRVVLATGHKREIIRAHFGAAWQGLSLGYAEETTPLGTGGALAAAFASQGIDEAIVLNGDTWCDAELAPLCETHAGSRSLTTLTLVEVPDGSRYGQVKVGEGWVTGFAEKGASAGPVLINAGLYVVRRAALDACAETPPFSFEEKVLQARAAERVFRAHVAAGARFIDIGVPEDYRRAQDMLAA